MKNTDLHFSGFSLAVSTKDLAQTISHRNSVTIAFKYTILIQEIFIKEIAQKLIGASIHILDNMVL